MRTLKYIILASFFLIALFFAIGFFILPAKREVSRSIEIDRPAKMIYRTINSMHNFNQWSPWAKLDPQAQYTFSGPKTGVGSSMLWKGNDQVGSGKQTIIEAEKNKLIKTELFFDGQGDGPSHAQLTLTENNGTTQVTWTFNADFKDNIISRYFGIMIENMLGPQYEKGLTNLKTLVEKQPVYDYSPISITHTKASNILYVQGDISGTPEEVSTALAKNYQQIMRLIAEKGLTLSAPPLTKTLSMTDKKWEYQAAVPISESSIDLDITSNIKMGKTYAGKAIKYIQKGSYEQAPKSYQVINAYMEENELKPNGYSWEVYISDPTEVPQANIITHIYQPIK